jgi:hypothetical protein
MVNNPRIRAETILDGVFSRGVVLVESEGDRVEYGAAAEVGKDYPSREVHLVAVGGASGMAEPCRFFRHLNIPVAVIADLDVIADTDQLATIIKELVNGRQDSRELIDKLRDAAQAAKALPPPITENEVKERLRALAEEPMDWTQGNDNVVRRKLLDLENTIKRVRRLKEGGIAAYVNEPGVMAKLQALVDACKSVGLFLVPVGELEDWVKELMSDHPKRSMPKTVRALIAAERIRRQGRTADDIWSFVASVLVFVAEGQNRGPA